MTKNLNTVLQPMYMKKFRCIGSSCEDTCCSGWRVEIDKPTYKRYKKERNETLKPLFREKVKMKKNIYSDNSIAYIVMNDDGNCPFLDNKRLCKIQIELGERFLSETCKRYPRNQNRIDGKLERSATISCPEVARLSLLNDEGIVFEQVEEEIEKVLKVGKDFNTQENCYLNKAQSFFWDIRIFSLSLLQNRSYAIGDRLILLGLFYKQIEELENENNIHRIPILIEQFQLDIEDNLFKEEIKKIDSNMEMQVQVVKHLVGLKKTSETRYNEYHEKVLNGLSYSADEEISKLVINYQEKLEEFTKVFMEDKDFILENFLVNEYFREVMPFGNYESIWDSYIFLCALYSIVKFHLVGVYGYYDNLSEKEAINTIQTLAKLILHDRRIINAIVSVLKQSGFDTLGYMTILVKN